MKKEKIRRTLVGWQGIVAEVPCDWSLASIGGDGKSGYFRVDSPHSLSLEVKWFTGSSERIDVRRRLEEFLKDLGRKARKRKVNFEYKIKSKEDGTISFTWQADRKAVGKLTRCDRCKRILIAQVSGLSSDNVSGVASQILPSLMDHSEDGWQTWAVYDLIAEVPPDYRLEKHQLMAGYIRLNFRKGVNRLTIERWGLADVALRKCTFTEWYADRVRYDFRPFRYSMQEVDFDGESAIEVTGRRHGLKEILRSASELLRGKSPAIFLDACAWVCEESNKIYSVQAIHSRQEKVFDEVVDRVECH
ncbi:MAG: hypothetical protein QHH26_07365 [Armatimonadota bacterium]|nr:hypothetical protein [Armatimonadota bacterium]